MFEPVRRAQCAQRPVPAVEVEPVPPVTPVPPAPVEVGGTQRLMSYLHETQFTRPVAPLTVSAAHVVDEMPCSHCSPSSACTTPSPHLPAAGVAVVVLPGMGVQLHVPQVPAGEHVATVMPAEKPQLCSTVVL
jgi:hypothetical protein